MNPAQKRKALISCCGLALAGFWWLGFSKTEPGVFALAWVFGYPAAIIYLVDASSSKDLEQAQDVTLTAYRALTAYKKAEGTWVPEGIAHPWPLIEENPGLPWKLAKDLASNSREITFDEEALLLMTTSLVEWEFKDARDKVDEAIDQLKDGDRVAESVSRRYEEAKEWLDIFHAAIQSPVDRNKEGVLGIK